MVQNNDFMGWNDEIKEDSNGFVLLPAGVYRFQVQKIDKTIYQGNSEKIGMGCPMATVGLQIFSPNGNTSVQDNIYLKKSLEWKISSFFRSIGFKEHGKGYKMDWDKALGAEGRCKLKVETWVGRDGQEKQSNRIESYIDSDTAPSAASQAPTAPAVDDSMPFEL